MDLITLFIYELIRLEHLMDSLDCFSSSSGTAFSLYFTSILNINNMIGKKVGLGSGRGLGLGEGQGRNKGGSFGPGGFCVCAKCGEKIRHQQGVKCTTIKCPGCGTTMIREELLNKKK